MTPVDVFFYMLKGPGIVEIVTKRAIVTKRSAGRESGPDPTPLDQ